MKWLVLVVALGFGTVACSSYGHQHGQSKGHHHRGGKKGMMGKKGKMHGMMNSDMHKKMAKMHQEVASCLDSGKSKDECKKIMKKHKSEMCPQMAKGKSCPMMQMMDESKKTSSSDDNHEAHH